MRAAQSFAAYHTGFKPDPDGDLAFAARAGDTQLKKLRSSVRDLTELSAETLPAIYAKASLVPMVDVEMAESNLDHICLSGGALAFVLKFADDVYRFTNKMINDQREAERQAGAK